MPRDAKIGRVIGQARLAIILLRDGVKLRRAHQAERIPCLVWLPADAPTRRCQEIAQTKLIRPPHQRDLYFCDKHLLEWAKVQTGELEEGVVK